MIIILKIILVMVMLLIFIYTVRHYIFTVNRLFGKQRHPYIDIDTANWPSVTVLVPAHNEEAVLANSLEALLKVTYPRDKLKIIVISDHSTDRTDEILAGFVDSAPDVIFPYYRKDGPPGKAASFIDVMQYVKSELIIVFDADYIPGRGLIKQLAAPFFDPEVGLVMGRVVPINTDRNLLTRLLDLERSGGYQVDQQARMNMDLVPQYGGTVGGIRVEALESVGGWLENTLAEDTDLTYRAILQGWKSVYQNRSECYEEVPETWPVRVSQITRWAKGHNQSMYRYTWACVTTRNIRFGEKLDALLLLGVYIMSPIIVMGWVLATILFYVGNDNFVNSAIALFALTAFFGIGNFAAFFEIVSAVYLDRGNRRILLLPFNICNFLISTFTVSKASITQLVKGKNAKFVWVKTSRFRDKNFSMGDS